MRTVFTAAVLLASFTSYAATRSVESGKVVFSTVAKGPLGATIDIEGECKLRGAADEGSDGKVSGSFVARWDSCDTGMDIRNKHMLEHFGAEKHPEIRLVIKGWQKAAAASPFTGDLTIKGVTKPVKGTASVSSGNLHAEFKVKLSDYKIKAPEKLGVVVQDETTVVVDGAVK